MQNKTRLKRLSMLRDMLMNHSKLFKEVKFNISYWREKEPIDEVVCSSMEKASKERGVACTSAACALGSAAIYKPFMKMGLKIKKNKGGYMDCPVFEGKEELEAGEAFFGITEEESRNLFWPSSYDEDENEAKLIRVTPERVAKRVEKLIKKYQKVA